MMNDMETRVIITKAAQAQKIKKKFNEKRKKEKQKKTRKLTFLDDSDLLMYTSFFRSFQLLFFRMN